MKTSARQAGGGKLFCKQGKWKGKIFDLAAEASIGRGSQNRIAIPEDRLSQRHARIFFDPSRGCYVLEDLKSRNGTALDGIPVRKPEPLGHLHVITFADTLDFIFQDMELCKQRHPERSVSPGPSEKGREEKQDTIDMPTIFSTKKAVLSSDETIVL